MKIRIFNKLERKSKIFLIFLSLLLLLEPAVDFSNLALPLEKGRISAANSSVKIELKKGWNLISPGGLEIEFSKLKQDNPKCKFQGTAKQWDSSEKYKDVDKLEPLRGVWVKLENKCTAEVSGNTGSDTLTLHKGWNMISVNEEKSFNEINVNCHPYANKLWWWKIPWLFGKPKYVEADLNEKLKPKRGYWVWVSNACQIGKGTNNCPIPDSIPPDEQNNKKVDWRCKKDPKTGNLVNLITRVKDQELCGACWAFTVIAGIEAQANINAWKANQPLPNLDLSEQYLAFCNYFINVNPCQGLDPHLGLYFAEKNGIPTENCSPYNPFDPNTGNFRTCDTIKKCSNLENELYKITYSNVGDPQGTLRNHGPIIAVVSNMPGAGGIGPDGTLNCQTSGDLHTLLIVGYNFEDPNNKYWIAKNSWGDSMPNGGYVKIKYNGPCQLDLKYVIDDVIFP